MKRLLSFSVFAMLLAATAPAWGHGFRIVNDSGKLVLFSDDPNAGGDPIYTVTMMLGGGNFIAESHPGFDVQSGITSGSSISFNVLGPLWFETDGGTPMPSPTGVDMLIEPQDILVPGSTTVTGTSGFQAGFLIGDYDGSELGTIEHQLYYSIAAQPSVPVGAFAITMQLTGFDSQGQAFTPSDPFVAVFNNGISMGNLPAVAGDLYAAAIGVPEPSSIVLASLSACGLFACWYRRRKPPRRAVG